MSKIVLRDESSIEAKNIRQIKKVMSSISLIEIPIALKAQDYEKAHELIESYKDLERQLIYFFR